MKVFIEPFSLCNYSEIFKCYLLKVEGISEKASPTLVLAHDYPIKMRDYTAYTYLKTWSAINIKPLKEASKFTRSLRFLDKCYFYL